MNNQRVSPLAILILAMFASTCMNLHAASIKSRDAEAIIERIDESGTLWLRIKGSTKVQKYKFSERARFTQVDREKLKIGMVVHLWYRAPFFGARSIRKIKLAD